LISNQLNYLINGLKVLATEDVKKSKRMASIYCKNTGIVFLLNELSFKKEKKEGF